MTTQYFPVANPSAETLQQSARRRPRKRARPREAAGAVGQPPEKRGKTSIIQEQLEEILAALEAESTLFVPQMRAPAPALGEREEDVPETDRLPAEMAAIVADPPAASWAAWHLPNPALVRLAALLDAPPAKRYTVAALLFWTQHGLYWTGRGFKPFLAHVRDQRPDFAQFAEGMAAQQHAHRFHVIADAALDALLHRVVPSAAGSEYQTHWRAFLRWIRPGGGAELRWRVNVAQRMLARQVWRRVLVYPPDIPFVADNYGLARLHNRVIVPLFNRVAQLCPSAEVPWGKYAQAESRLAELSASQHLLLGTLLTAVKDYKACVRKTTVRHPVPLETRARAAFLPLPPSLPPDTTFAGATAVIVAGRGSDPWTQAHEAHAAEIAAVVRAEAIATATHQSAEVPVRTDREQADEAAWFARTWAPTEPPAAPARFEVVWRLYALAFDDAVPEHLLRLLRRTGTVSPHYQPPTPVPVVLRTDAPDEATVRRLVVDQGPLVEQRVTRGVKSVSDSSVSDDEKDEARSVPVPVPPVPAAPVPDAAPSLSFEELSGGELSVDFSD